MRVGLLITFLFTILFASAQTLTAIVKDSVTQQSIAFAGITNINSKKTIIGNKTGNFSIDAKVNDVISIAAVGYSFDTVHVSREMLIGKQIIFSLHPLSARLPDVIVTTNKYSQYQLDSTERSNKFFGTMNRHTQPVASLANSGAGIGINFDHFYKANRDKRNAISLFTQIEKEQYINYRFTPSLVNKYSNLSPDSTMLFMQQYRPEYNWLRKHTTEEDLLYYMNEKLKLFLKN